ncbi:MAG: sensor domain-containing diguanylate cyclase [Nitrospiraceae bacterium]|nr:sensor domain-containing diguanylate cyclase [Nitrospiraceae bacterium]
MKSASHGIHNLERAIWYISDLTGLSCMLYSGSGALLAASHRSDLLLSAYRRDADGMRRYRRFLSSQSSRVLLRKAPVVAKGPTGQQHLFIPVLRKDAPLVVVAEGFYTSPVAFSRIFEKHHQEQWMSGLTLDEWQKGVATIPEERIPEMLAAAGRVLTEMGEKDMLQAYLRGSRAIQEYSKQEPGYADLVEAVSSLTNAGTVAFLERHNGSFCVTAATGKHRQGVEALSIPSTHEALGQRAADQYPICISNAGTLQEAGFPGEIYAAELFPVTTAGGNPGFLAVLNEQLSIPARRLINRFCRRMAALFLMKENCRGHRRRIDSVGLTELKISYLFFKHGNWQGLCNGIVREAASLVGADKCSLMVPDTSRLLRVNSAVGRKSPAYAAVRIRPGEGIAGSVYERGEPLLLQAREDFKKYNTSLKPAFRTSSCLSMPLKIGDRILGILNLSDKSTGAAFSADDLTTLAPFVLQASMLLELARYHRLARHLGELSITDPLTGIYNRRYFDMRLAEEYQRARRHGHDLSLAIADVDNFKIINDTLGHVIGDRVLTEIATAITNMIRTHDVVARLGGDEFAIIMPRTSRQEASHVTERIRESIKQCLSRSCGILPDGAATVCIGYTTYPDCGEPKENLICRADRALYKAKTGGKDVVTGL